VAANYRHVTTLVNESMVFESVIYPQFEKWIDGFIPYSQFGFAKGCGTVDYGLYVSTLMANALEARQEGLLIPLDVKGAFDRVWWARVKRRLAAAGLSGDALGLIRDYLESRFIKVVVGAATSAQCEIFSGVPQGARLSPKIWNFDIRDMPAAVGNAAEFMSYADDCNLWFGINDQDRVSPAQFVARVNQVLLRLSEWGVDNNTAFEPTKMMMMVVSKKQRPFDPTGVKFEGIPVKQVSSTKIVGFTFDSKFSWAEHIEVKAKSARCRIGALRKLSRFLDSQNMKLMYTCFVRPVLEYGQELYVAAAPSHLASLDRVQRAAQRLGGFEVEPLAARRDAAVLSFALKLLDYAVVRPLWQFMPKLVLLPVSRLRSRPCGIQIKPVTLVGSLDSFKRSFFGRLPSIWAKLPMTIMYPNSTPPPAVAGVRSRSRQ
jgi:hypothetical protein